MNFKYEKEKIKAGFTHIVGCDEVGRGCLAGPVVAAAVVLDLSSKIKDLNQVRDSKLLTPQKREEISEIIKEHALAWSVAEVSSQVVDKINIHNASLLAMRRAVEKLPPRVSFGKKILLCLDGKFLIPKFDMKQEAVVSGDNKILSVAAASIIAKVYRDGLMRRLHFEYPEYNFARHKGYATLHHRRMVMKYGLSEIHRVSFCGNLKTP